MADPGKRDSMLISFARAIIAGDVSGGLQLLAESPALASAHFENGATRRAAQTYYLDEIGHYIYAGETALHIAAARYRHDVVRKLIGMDADVRARNRRGAEPLHAAAVGISGSRSWNPPAQVATIACLIEAGADPNAIDKTGVTPLHRAVRTRCAATVRALIEGGADVRRENKNGSTPFLLATQNTAAAAHPRRRRSNKRFCACWSGTARPDRESWQEQPKGYCFGCQSSTRLPSGSVNQPKRP